MEQKINKILKDLYMVDESLKKHEKDLIKITKKFIESKPETEFSEEFANKLKEQILQKAKEMIGLEKYPTNHHSVFFKFGYMLSGAMICAVIVIPIVGRWNLTHQVKVFEDLNLLTLNENIKEMSNEDFGLLSVDVSSSEIAMESKMASVGGGGDDGVAVNTKKMSADSMMIGMPAPERINYNYIYSSGEIDEIEENYAVYKKNKEDGYDSFLGDSIKSKDFGLVDIDKFKNLKVSNINFVEDRDYGYTVYYNSKEQVASISMNWEKWPRLEREREDKLSIGDVPSDDKLIKMAREFLIEYGISLDNYDDGQVQDNWRRHYNEVENNYISESAQVIFPLKIKDQIVYDQSGNETGITVTINIRNNKVSGVHNIIIPSYESSNYESVSDVNMLLGSAKNGGMHRSYKHEDPTETIDVELGDPKLGLIKYWRYDEVNSKNEELFVPALIFSIINKPESKYFYQENVTVPLVKDVFDQINKDREDLPGIPELLR